MTPIRFFGIGFLILLIGVFAVGGYFVHKHHRVLQEGCDRIEAIARNREHVAYMEQWASENAIGKGYYFVSGMDGSIAGHSSIGSEKIHYLQLSNPERTGIETKYLRFGVEKFGVDFKTPITEQNVGQINFGRGRNSVIIVRNNQLLTEHRGRSLDSRHLRQIRENVFAYCSDARFRM